MTRDETPVFPHIGIVGLGLIGGSIALAARQRWPDIQLTAVDRHAVLEEALSARVITRAAADLGDLANPDLIILAAPVGQNVDILRKMGTLITRPTVMTDVGGTKRVIVDAAQALPPAVTFVGGHPLGGSAHSGLSAATANLFAGRPWIFTPSEATPPAAMKRLTAFASALGAIPTSMSARAHDRLMAFVSHLPQLTATALMDTIGDAVSPADLALAGGGLVDTTRLASSPASIWGDICSTNADALGTALDLLIAKLDELRRGLTTSTTIEEIFSDAARWRAELMKTRS